jgi:HAD superfamily hydrolase (TIGR01490 family)
MARKFAVFDIDGTLIRWQLYHAVVDRLAKKNLLGPDAHTVLHEARMVWKRREHPDAFRTYEHALIKIYEEALPNISTDTFDQVAAEIAAEYKTQSYTYTRKLVQDLKEKGYLLFAISGSHEELLRSVAEQYGFDDCIGTTYERKGSAFTGSKFVGNRDKRANLKSLISKHTASLEGSVGVGDSRSDAAFLEMVERPIAFNPDRELYDLARKHGWQIVVERKNVVYELNKRGEDYLLNG